MFPLRLTNVTYAEGKLTGSPAKSEPRSPRIVNAILATDTVHQLVTEDHGTLRVSNEPLPDESFIANLTIFPAGNGKLMASGLLHTLSAGNTHTPSKFSAPVETLITARGRTLVPLAQGW